jgi:N-methylhydantoinase B
MFVMGGMGARATKDGLHCMSYPANSSNLPVEVLEAAIPVRVRHKRLRPDSGGPGRFRGGCGQELELESVSPAPLTVRAEHGKLRTAPAGLRGGGPGLAGGNFLNGRPVEDKLPLVLQRGDVLTLQIPGSGGMYPPRERDPEAVRRDVENGIVSPEAARRDYAHAPR